MATKEFFPGIEKIKFEGKDSKNPMAFRYYDAEKVIIWGIERSGFFNGREKWAKGFENQRV